MKKMLSLMTLACCLFCISGYAATANQDAVRADNSVRADRADRRADARADVRANQNVNQAGKAANGQCPADHPADGCDQPTGECYCLYVHYEPRYYTTQRCVEEKIPCTKKCWRKVPEQYEVQRCKMVPEYYTETCTRYRDECYEEPDCKCVKKMVCDEHCEYVPQYYWKHVCCNPDCPEKK